VSPSPVRSFSAGFVRTISRKFPDGRFLIVGASGREIEREFARVKREAAVASRCEELGAEPGPDQSAAHFETAVWFYCSEAGDDDRMAEALSRCANRVVLLPGPGAQADGRRPQLVERFGRFGLLPDYQCDLTELDSAAVCLRRQLDLVADSVTPAVEAAFARLHTRLGDLKRSLEIRNSEVEGAHHHIAALEAKLLKLKKYRRESKLLQEQKQSLRKSPERRIGQVLLAPYRLPEKLAKTVWKKLRRSVPDRRRSVAPSEYQQWFERHRATAPELDRMRNESRKFASRPLISVITPVFETPVRRLEEAIQSVVAQAYENWELVLIDDGSSDTALLRALPVLAARDRRIILKSLAKHEGISAAMNQGLALGHGEWVAFLDHDDVIEPDGLFQIVKLLQTQPDTDLIYSDEDKLGEKGLEAPLFKPDWSPDFFLSYNYIGHLTAVRRNLVREAGGFRSQFDSAQDYDLLFRVIERTQRIHHIPRVLYHWRRSESSSAISVRQKPKQFEASRLAIEDHLKRRGESAHVAVDWRTHAFNIRRGLLEPKKISVIIWSDHGLAALEQCIESLTHKTTYSNYEIVTVGDNEFHGASAFRCDFPYRAVRFPDEANDSAVKNFAVNQTNSPWILFLDYTTEAINPDWLTIMAEHVQRPEIGAVGARLLSANGTIEQAGIVVGVDKIAQPAFHGFPAEHPGANRQLQVTRNCSAVSSACMLTKREVFQETGGFDETLEGSLADVDLCLKIRRCGYLIVYTPFAKLWWHEASADRVDINGQSSMHERWAGILRSDPYYNPNLSRERGDFSLGK